MARDEINTHFRTCNLCEACCGLKIEYQNDHILSIKGDQDDVLSKGHICPKALALQDIHEDPDRIKTPLLKTTEGWQAISWKKALNLAASKIKQTQAEFGQDSVGVYYGNPTVHHHGTVLYLLPLLDAIGTRNRFSSQSNDNWPHARVNLEMFGNQLLYPTPDIDHTDLFILMGANPVASNGSIMTAPGFDKRIKALKKRGGEFIVIDPRQTETALIADRYLPIRPGTDALFLLGMVHALFNANAVDMGRLKQNVDDIAQIQLMCADFAPDVVAPICGIEANTIRELALKLAQTPKAACFGRMGTSTQEFGTLATWLFYVINVLTGHMDERGGLMFTKPAVDTAELLALAGMNGHVGEFKSRVKGLPEFADELPASTLADEILTPGEGQIKTMLVAAGNPVLSCANSERMKQAFESLDFMISIDLYKNETSAMADLILPPTSHLEQTHYDIVFNLFGARNTARFSEALFTPPDHAKHDWEILLELTRRISSRNLKKRAQAEAEYRLMKSLGPDRILDLLLRLGPYGTQVPGTIGMGAFLMDAIQDLLEPKHIVRRILDIGPYGTSNRALSKGLCLSSLKQYPHGIDLGPLQSCLPERLKTEHQHIKLAPPSFISDIGRLRSRMSTLAPADEQLLLIGRRDVRSNNSWMHNSHRLVKGKDRCTLMIHPEDASSRQIQSGDIVRVTRADQSIDLPAEVTEQIMQGVISVPHGWGHDEKGVQLSIASRKPGTNVNRITDHEFIDKLSGTTAFNGISVQCIKLRSTRVSQKKPRVRAVANL